MGVSVCRIMLEIERSPEGPHLGTSPELPGLVVQGDSADEVIALAPQVARDLIAVMLSTGEPLPARGERLAAPARVPILVPA